MSYSQGKFNVLYKRQYNLELTLIYVVFESNISVKLGEIKHPKYITLTVFYRYKHCTTGL